MRQDLRFRAGSFVSAAAALMMVAIVPRLALAQQPGQSTFPSAEEASQAFYTAAQRDDESALTKILGPDGKDIISSGDAVEDLRDRTRFVVKFKEMHRLVKEGDGSTMLYVGAENWPMPIPLANKGNGWYFDTDAGKQEILFRRVGRERTACHAGLPLFGGRPDVVLQSRLSCRRRETLRAEIRQ
ncbi:MAG: DUF2950 family protein [Ignavibacteriota bacterium]